MHPILALPPASTPSGEDARPLRNWCGLDRRPAGRDAEANIGPRAWADPRQYASEQEVTGMSAATMIQPDPVPLAMDGAGRLMVVGTRVPVDTLISAFKRGESPEAIHESFDTVALADVYAVLAYYLRHRADIEQYLSERERQGTEIQARMESEYPSDGLRARLLARLGS